ncbi:DUF2946 domain-containing protein [Sneathiella limimaris]|uniref:DUF2946 domain-containing protein n=1 Tax=Sneathiella limimaris TaxID=1964213 RepID=UPI00146C145A|nr:DUF2946 domain-containing protein [Sneathiella limimaris]
MKILTAFVSGFPLLEGRSRSRKERFNRFHSLVAVFAIFLNLLVPVTHATASAVAEDGYLEICTSSGVERVSLSELGISSPASSHDEHCDACADCSDCRLSPSLALFLFPKEVQNKIQLNELVSVFGLDQTYQVTEPGRWPESRAPPFKTS